MLSKLLFCKFGVRSSYSVLYPMQDNDTSYVVQHVFPTIESVLPLKLAVPAYADHKIILQLEKDVDVLMARLTAEMPIETSKALLADVTVSTHSHADACFVTAAEHMHMTGAVSAAGYSANYVSQHTVHLTRAHTGPQNAVV